MSRAALSVPGARDPRAARARRLQRRGGRQGDHGTAGADSSPWRKQFARLNPAKPFPACESPLAFEPFATPCSGEVVLGKPSFCATLRTGLAGYLRDNGIDTCILLGLITSVCVQHSAFGLFEAGFRTLVVGDACADRGRDRHEAALMLYGNYIYELIPTSADLEAMLPSVNAATDSNGTSLTVPRCRTACLTDQSL